MKGVASCTSTLQGQGRYRLWGIGGMVWWEGGGGCWEGKEARWWATDRLVRGPTVNLAASRSLRPCTCWILAGRGGWGLQWRASVV